MIIALIGMDEINDTDPFYSTMGIPTILTFHHLNVIGIALILNAVIQNKIGFSTVINQRFC